MVQKQGFKFYAARGMPAPDSSDQEVQLAYDFLPQSSVTLLNESMPDWCAAATAIELRRGLLPVAVERRLGIPICSFEGATVAGRIFRYAYGYDDDVLDRDR